jgi:hypothetical protein
LQIRTLGNLTVIVRQRIAGRSHWRIFAPVTGAIHPGICHKCANPGERPGLRENQADRPNCRFDHPTSSQ